MMSCIELPGNLLTVNPLCGKSKEGDISYQLLLNASSVESDRLSSNSSTCSNDLKQVTLNFYMENGSEQKLVVEENLRILDLCQLLALKFNVARSHTWALVEQLTALGIERTLEDHEEILTVYASWKEEKDRNKFIFKQDFCKYEFFRTPQQFFPLAMMNLGSVQLDCLAESSELAQLLTLQSLLISGEESPCIQSLLWYKNVGEDSWKRLFFRIDGTTLFISSASKEEKRQFWPLKDLQEYEIYMPIENTISPTSYSFCLKPRDYSTKDLSNLLWLCCENEKQRLCWIIAMRLAKHGRKIRENYKELQLRHSDSPSVPVDSIFSDYTPMKPRVAMDFTGSRSRVVEDPSEAKAIAAAEGHLWKRRLPCCRSPSCSFQNVSSRPVSELGIHALQPWFYSGMSRDEATQLLTKYGTVDGVFLVRESRRNPGSFVLSYVFNHKIHHCQIFPVEEKDQLCYSLDNGKTKFYDLLQLVEFYQLNLGSLPTKLTHFLVHRPHSSRSSE